MFDILQYRLILIAIDCQLEHLLVHYDHLWVILIHLLRFVAKETLVLALLKLEADSWKTELPLEQKVEQLLPRRYSVIGLVSCFVQGSYGVQS